jgi:HK97 family phage prohead protease|tara:strand:+ start:4826 stop:5545 length:720 start_codon:yes stop_codon:yes gene_type:complete
MNLFQTKNIDFQIKDIDTAGRRVKMALSRFNNVDSDGDIIVKGAFSKSIQERGPDSQSNRKIKFLRYHDFENQIGIFKQLEETQDYLLAYADLGRSTKGNDAFLDYQDGIITEHSIGFQTINDKIEVRQDGTQILKEVILWEGSAVTFGANSETPLFSVSKGNSEDYLAKLNKKMNGLTNALKNGKGTDERLEAIEMNIRVCQTKYNDVINSLRIKEPTQVTPDTKSNENKDFYLHLLK